MLNGNIKRFFIDGCLDGIEEHGIYSVNLHPVCIIGHSHVDAAGLEVKCKTTGEEPYQRDSYYYSMNCKPDSDWDSYYLDFYEKGKKRKDGFWPYTLAERKHVKRCTGNGKKVDRCYWAVIYGSDFCPGHTNLNQGLDYYGGANHFHDWHKHIGFCWDAEAPKNFKKRI